MNMYGQLISNATGIVDEDRINMIEQYMRQIYFHSTLSWQEADDLHRAARESAQELEVSGWDFR